MQLFFPFFCLIREIPLYLPAPVGAGTGASSAFYFLQSGSRYMIPMPRNCSSIVPRNNSTLPASARVSHPRRFRRQTLTRDREASRRDTYAGPPDRDASRRDPRSLSPHPDHRNTCHSTGLYPISPSPHDPSPSPLVYSFLFVVSRNDLPIVCGPWSIVLHYPLSTCLPVSCLPSCPPSFRGTTTHRLWSMCPSSSFVLILSSFPFVLLRVTFVIFFSIRSPSCPSC